jgi:hypothetical protein
MGPFKRFLEPRRASGNILAGEILSRLNYDSAPAAAIVLTTDSSVLTAIGNDYGYERVLERQIFGSGRPGDVLIAISTPSRSPNILHAISAGHEKCLTVVGFTGRPGGEDGWALRSVPTCPGKWTPRYQADRARDARTWERAAAFSSVQFEQDPDDSAIWAGGRALKDGRETCGKSIRRSPWRPNSTPPQSHE